MFYFKDECVNCKFCFRCVTRVYPKEPDPEINYGDDPPEAPPEGKSFCDIMQVCELMYHTLTEDISPHPYYGKCLTAPAFLCPHPDTKEELERYSAGILKRKGEDYTQIPTPDHHWDVLIADDDTIPRMLTVDEWEEQVPDSEVEEWIKQVALEDYKRNLRESIELSHTKEELDM